MPWYVAASPPPPFAIWLGYTQLLPVSLATPHLALLGFSCLPHSLPTHQSHCCACSSCQHLHIWELIFSTSNALICAPGPNGTWVLLDTHCVFEFLRHLSSHCTASPILSNPWHWSHGCRQCLSLARPRQVLRHLLQPFLAPQRLLLLRLVLFRRFSTTPQRPQPPTYPQVPAQSHHCRPICRSIQYTIVEDCYNCRGYIVSI